MQTANSTGTTPMFVAPASFDYHLVAGSPCQDAGHDPGMTGTGASLAPVMEYVHPVMVEGRVSVGTIDIGAFELGGATPLVDGGDTVDMAMMPIGDPVTGVGSHGCGCTLGARPEPPAAALLLAIASLFFAIRRG